jgi:hypothetical protein
MAYIMKGGSRVMTTLIDFLQEMEQSHQTVVLPAEEVERLAKLFGPSVRSMGFWDKSGNGSVEIPMNNVTEAARALDNGSLARAVAELKSSGDFAGMMDHSLAGRLIERLASLYLPQFQDRVERFQESTNPSEADHRWGEISRELFGA